MGVLRIAVATLVLMGTIGAPRVHADRHDARAPATNAVDDDRGSVYLEARHTLRTAPYDGDTSDRLDELAEVLRERAYEWADVWGVELPDAYGGSLCAFATGSVRGSAGTARLGGGGTLQSFTPAAVSVADVPAVANPTARTLVIVDDFGGRPPESPGLGATNPSHGDIVLFHTLAVLASGGLGVQDTQVLGSGNEGWDGVRLTVADGSGRHVMDVVLVSFAFDDPDGVVVAFADLGRWTQDSDDVVINMSWNLGDCAIVTLYREVRHAHRDGDPALGLYRRFISDLAFVDEGVRGILETLCNAVLTTLTSSDCRDPVVLELVMHAALDVHVERLVVAKEVDIPTDGFDGIVRVAAAGNESLPFPLPPASFRCVIGVAASLTSDPGTRASWSNRGGFTVDDDRTELGAFFRTGRHGDGEGEELFYGGTSFAAPLAALTSHVSQVPDCGP